MTTWQKLSDSLSWSQGHRGRGYLLHNGTIKTWNVDPSSPLDHNTIWYQNGELSPSALNFEIDPDGGVVTDQPSSKVESIILADPRLYDAGQRPVFEDSWDLQDWDDDPEPKKQPDYNFVMGALRRYALETPWGQDWDEWMAQRPAYDASGHQLGYDPSQHAEGKGFILSDGSVWTWPTHEWQPMHMAYDKQVKQNGQQVVPATAFHIQNGQVAQYGPGRYLTPENRQLIMQADPRLEMYQDTDGQTPGSLQAPPEPSGYGHGRTLLDILDAQDRGKQSSWPLPQTGVDLPWCMQSGLPLALLSPGERQRTPYPRQSPLSAWHEPVRAREHGSSIWEDYAPDGYDDAVSRPDKDWRRARDKSRPKSLGSSSQPASPRGDAGSQAPAWPELEDESQDTYGDSNTKMAARPIIQTRTERLGLHHHPLTGLPCSCQWGKPKRPPRYRIGMTHVGGSQYIRQIRNQNQKVFRDEHGQRFLEGLEHLLEEYPDAEAMAPWMASRFKKGDFTVTSGGEIKHHEGYGGASLEDYLLDLVKESLKPTTRWDNVANNQGRTLAQQLAWDRWDKLPWHERYDELGKQKIEPNPELRLSPKDAAQLAAYNYHPALRPLRDSFTLTNYRLPAWQNWFNARQHPTRRGVNIMEHSPQEIAGFAREHEQALQEAEKKKRWIQQYVTEPQRRQAEAEAEGRTFYPEYSEGEAPKLPPDVQHTFGPEAGKYQGWNVVHLSPFQAEGDSDALGHCIGDYEDQPYHYNIGTGNIDAYSLRDAEGYPHVTWHINPSGGSIGHLQGQGTVPDKYRNLVSMFNEAKGLPDEETHEERLEDAPERYDEYVDVPAATSMSDYVGQHSDLYAWIPDDTNVGDNTEINQEEPDWSSIADDYLRRGSYNGNFFRALKERHETVDFAWALGQEYDPEDSEQRSMVNFWNSEGATGRNDSIELPPREVDEVSDYTNALDEGEEPQIGNYDRMAQDYLKYPRHYRGGDYYDQFHEQLRHEPYQTGDMNDALSRNIDWSNPDHLEAIDEWNKHWDSYPSSYGSVIEHPEMPAHNDYGEYMPYAEREDEEPMQATSAWHWEASNWEGLAPMQPIRVKPAVPPQPPRSDDEMIYHLIGEAAQKGDYEYARWLYQFLPQGLQPSNPVEAKISNDHMLAPAVELSEWLADLGGSEPEAPSIHHDSIEDTVMSPSVSPSQALPYFPPANIPKEYKQGAAMPQDEWQTAVNALKDRGTEHSHLWCPNCGNKGIIHVLGAKTGHPMWFCPHCEMKTARDVPMTGDSTADSLIYEGLQNDWRPRHEVQNAQQQADVIEELLGLWDDEDQNNAGRLEMEGILRHEQPQALEEPDDHLEEDLFDPNRLPQQEEPDWNAVPEQHRQQAQEQWAGLTPEQREQMRQPPPELMERLQAGLPCAGCGEPIQGAFGQDAGTDDYYHMQCLPEQDMHLASVHHSWDAPINQADATNDPLGKNPALVPQRQGDPDYLDASYCPGCHQTHRPDEPCPDSSIKQYKQQERQWYNRDPNAIHSQPDGLDDHVSGFNLFRGDPPYRPSPEEMAQGQMCRFHPDRPAVRAEGFAPMCEQCAANYDKFKSPVVAGWTEDLEEEIEPDSTELKLAAMQESILKLATALQPEKRPRKLVIKRDENGKMASIEEV